MERSILEIAEIKLRGTKEINGMKFHDIEGGFGEGKESMLAKDIAFIHGKEPREINERITFNRKRFKDNVDIIDLLGIGLTDTEIKQFGVNRYEYIKRSQLNQAFNIIENYKTPIVLQDEILLLNNQVSF